MNVNWLFWGFLAVIFGVSVPVSIVGVSISIATSIGLITALAGVTGYYWLRGIPPMDFLWHGWDDNDLQPILDGDER
jgi:hypothetical protein